MKWESYSHPISDIRDWDNNNRLELKPDFQRNEVWSRAAQIMLIDTIIKGIPIPKIYIKSVMHNGNTYRVVIDGQQRLTAILKFVKNKLRLSKPYSGEYEGSLFSDLPDEVQNEILRYKIDINEIFNPSEEEIRDLYSRVNKYPGGIFSAENIDTTPLIKELILEAISNDYHKRPQDGLELVEKFNNATYYQ